MSTLRRFLKLMAMTATASSLAACSLAANLKTLLPSIGGGGNIPSCDAVSFSAQSNVAVGTVIDSNTVTLSGCAEPVAVAVAGDGSPVLYKNDVPVAVASTASSGDTLRVRLTSAAEVSTLRRATVTVGGMSADFEVSTTSDATSPSLTSVTGPAAGTYILATTLEFAANFDESVHVTGSPRLGLTIGATTKYAIYHSGSGTTTLTFRYTIEDGAYDADGIAVGAFELNSGTIKDGAGNAASLAFTAPSTTGVLVNVTAPNLIVPRNCNWDGGQTLAFNLVYDSPVTVTGTPRLRLTMDSGEAYAEYVRGSGSTSLWFHHKIAAGESDSDGINVNPSLDLNGGTIIYAHGTATILNMNVPDLSLVKIIPTSTEELRGRWKLDEGASSTIVDHGPYSLGTTVTGSPTWAIETSLNTLVFNGLDSFLDIGNPSEVRPANGLTISAWAKVNDGWDMLVSHGNWNNFHLLYEDGKITAGIRSPGATLTTDETFPQGEWFHVAMTYDQTTFSLYVNGTLRKSVPLAGSLSYGGGDQALRIGTYSSWGSLWAPLKGSLRDVRLYGKGVSSGFVGSMACGL